MHYDLWVLELSSFQFDLTFSLKPIAATILNISPDHLDRHHSLAAYVSAKQRIYKQRGLSVFITVMICKPCLVNNRSHAELALVSDSPTLNEQWGIIEQNGNPLPS